MNSYLNVMGHLFPEASCHAYEDNELPSPDVDSIIKGLIDQVAYLAQRNTPMWQDGLSSSLNLEEYKKKYSSIASLDQFTSLSSRVLNANLPVTSSDLKAHLTDPGLLVKIFPSILGYASSRYDGGDDLVLDVDYEVSPLLRSGEKRVVRCVRQLPYSKKCVIAEFSMRKRSTSPPADFIKLPSGLVVEDNIDGSTCTVTIVDHWMIKNGARTPALPSSNGAHLLLMCLQRHYIRRYPEERFGKKGFQTIDYKGRVAELSTRMIHSFFNGITGVRGIDGVTEKGWSLDEASGEKVHIFKKETTNGEWKISSVASVRVSATASSLLQVLDNWHGFEMGEVEFRMWRGHAHSTENICISVYNIKRPGKSDGFLIEETHSGEPKMTVRAVLDGPTYEGLVRKGDDNPDTASLLPFGFVVHPASEGCCTVAVGYQFEAKNFNAEDVKKMLSHTLTRLTT